ncbi:Methyltransferase domain-containing protein [Andreprevotia lacus DSM 23236]|jgi:ubiquinone/menaquinone biosynthesis C-methylase UbiE|uniref:Methyltransferase domain-containing protein n=1 Tax=Andreprevotia lacus DSM 23236 TaxID=1121001 RepID=A0A1W1XWZ5_9NEIS|nr:methyltransferase domain-containing protein [Andreprevotia lacus]SMC28385.1 Methyltransferase domain-containing protein [Andreprevotia lacus DSM 23236]
MPSLTLDTPELAEQYDRVSDLQYEHGQHLLNALQLKPGETLLDVGCGTGRLTAFAARHFIGPTGRVLGIDPLPLRIDIGRRRAEELGLAQLSFNVGQAEALHAVADASADAVVLNSVYHWLPDKAPALAEAIRVLKPGGRIAISSASRERPHDVQRLVSEVLAEAGLGRGQGSGSTPHKVSFGELAFQLESAGFHVDEIRLRRFADRFADADSVLAFNQSSSFGNFLGEFLPQVRQQLIARFNERLQAHRDERGILLHRNLLFAVAHKPATR